MYSLLNEAVRKKPVIAVVGDIMLDRYIIGKAKRISPEAPVPVVSVEDTRDILGGAGNVARNLVSMGCDVACHGVVGNDTPGTEVIQLLETSGIENSLVLSEFRSTTVKTRVLSQGQQLVRIDAEHSATLSDQEIRQVLANIKAGLGKSLDVVVLSDYGKGFCHPELCSLIIQYGLKHGIPVIIDPKGLDWEKYRGAYLLTPNLHELSQIYGVPLDNDDEAVLAAALKVKALFNIENLLVTRSEKGMTLIDGTGATFHLHTEAVDVFDVSGAGDTVVAALAWLLGAGLPLDKAMAGANVAAGIAVAHVGTYAVRANEILNRIRKQEDQLPRRGVFPRKEAEFLGDSLKKSGEKIVFTNGCFDLLHAGHLSYLKAARELGDVLIVGLNSDASVTRLKGASRPVNTIETRASLLAALRFVDYVVVFEEDTPWDLLKDLKPHILVKGGDYKPEDVVGREFSDEVRILPFVAGYSSTNTINRINQHG
jgi:D-beta-D-heptose 7-phosphate kinase / D-beta-D-heptose 1-phosphate adenosyltransferase